MPVNPANPTVNAGPQVNLASQPPSTQSNFAQMIGEVEFWNPDAPIPLIQTWLNNAYREVIDSRMWYGLMVRGQVTVPSVYTTGTVSVVNGSNTVTGVGTAWDSTFIGRQFRSGFTTGFYTIVDVPNATTLTLELPWGNQTQGPIGYSILKNLVSLGANIKYVLEMVNQRQGYRLFVNMPQKMLNIYDTWRTSTGWTFLLANREPSSSGSPQFELYPAPTFQQAFPYLAYVQPPNMSKPGDYPYTFIRSDVIVRAAIKDALLFRGKNSRYYDPQTATMKYAEFKAEVNKMMAADDCLYPKDLQWDQYRTWPFSEHGSLWLQSHAGSESWGF